MGKAEDLNGQWSSDWGAVDLQVADGKITGTWPQGTMAGTAGDDGAVALTCTHRDATVGKGKLQADSAFKKLEGTWGFDDDDAGEGAWVMSQSKRVKVAAPEPEPEPAPAAEEKKADEPKADDKKADEPKADDKKADDKPAKK